MGMDVFGLNPTSETGEYFRRNVWGWHPLAKFIVDNAPAGLTDHCESWHDNSGCGLGAEDSRQLAEVLDIIVKDGRAAAYVKSRDAWLASLPDERCRICPGTGIRVDALGREAGHPEKIIDEAGHPRQGQKGWCNGCDGKGTLRPWDTNYYLEVSDIEEFAAFLRDCGGFTIC